MHKLYFVRFALAAATLAMCAALFATRAQAADSQAKPSEGASIVNGLRVKRFVQPLSLTAEQQQKFKALMDEESLKIAQSQQNTVIDRPARIAEQRKIKVDYRKKMEEVLTPEQREKWAKMDAETEASRRRRSRSAPATPAGETKPAPKNDSSEK